MHATKQNCLNLNNALLISCASLSVVSRTIIFLFEVLSSFPYGSCLLSVSCQFLALEGVYLPFWAAFPSNPTHRKRYVAAAQCVAYGIVTLYDALLRVA